MTKELKLLNDKQLPKLTRKQKAFVDVLIANPKMSATKAVMQTYNAKSPSTAKVMAHENLTKPNVMMHLVANAERAEQKVIELLNADKQEVQLASAKDILDRVHGKATQKVEQQTTGVMINIDLSTNSDSTD